MTPSQPHTFGRYEVVRPLGRGAIGEVYLARDPQLHRLVAIKILSGLSALPPGEQDEARERFLREARSAAALNHPNIVTVHDVGEQDGHPYIAMEFLEGTTLDRHTKQKHLLPPSKVLEIGIRAAHALEEAHTAGLVHRDVKPANLVLLEDGTVKVTDFGLAKDQTAALTANDSILGTPNYMSPEQIAGRPLDGRSDLFSLAVALFELLAGERPFSGSSVSSVLYRIVNEPPPSLRNLRPELPEALERLLETMLSKDPGKRLPTGSKLAAALKRILAAMGGVPPSLELPLPASRTKPREESGASGSGTAASSESATPRKRRGRLVLMMLALALVSSVAAVWTAPRWLGSDPLEGRRPEVQRWLSENLGSFGDSLSVTPLASRVAVRTEPPGLTVEVQTTGVELDTEGWLVIPADRSEPFVVSVRDECREGEATVDPAALPSEVSIATEAVLVDVPLASEPAGAKVEVDGVTLDERTPALLSLEACRAHTIALSARGRPEREVSLPEDGDAAAWRRELARVELAPLLRGKLEVPAAPYPVRVILAAGGRAIGRAGSRIDLDPGRYRLRLVARELLYEEDVTARVEPGRSTTLQVDYPAIGRLTVRAVPPGGDVLVRRSGAGDAVKLGETPINGHRLVAGTYDVTVAHPARGVQVTKTTVVQGGGDGTVVVVGSGEWP